jgi:hypothetical protein
VDEAAKVVGSSQASEVDIADQRRCRIGHGWRPLVEIAVGAVGVVVLDVRGEDCFEVSASEDQHPVKALAADGADHALADGVDARGLDRGLDDPDGVATEDGVEGGGVFGVAIADEELDRGGAVGEFRREVAGLLACWCTQSEIGLVVTPAIRTRRLSWWMNTST